MNAFSIRLNKIKDVPENIRECRRSLERYRGNLERTVSSLDVSMQISSYSSIRRRLNKLTTQMERVADSSERLGNLLDQVLVKYRETEERLSSVASGRDNKQDCSTPSISVSDLKDIIERIKYWSEHSHTDNNGFAPANHILQDAIYAALLIMQTRIGDGGTGDSSTGASEKKSIWEKISDMFNLPGDVYDAFGDLYDVLDESGFDETNIGGVVTAFLGALGGGATIAGSNTSSELYRNAVGYGKDSAGAMEELIKLLKTKGDIPDNNVTAGFLFGLSELKYSFDFSKGFLENYEKNYGNAAGFLRDSGEMVDSAADFVRVAFTSKDGFLKGLEGKELITAKIWKTTFSSLYTAASYTTGDLIDKAKKGNLDWGSGAESFAKGAVGGLGKIHQFLTLGLVDPDLEKTWAIYQKHIDTNSQLLNKYGTNWITKAGVTVYATGKTFICGTGEAIWMNSNAAAEKIASGFGTAYQAVTKAGKGIWENGKKWASSLFRRN